MQLTRRRIPMRAVGVAAAATSAMTFVAYQLRTATPVKAGGIVVAALSPIVLYVMFAAPLLFPYGAYVLLTPFDGLLALGKVGTLTKFLGMGSAVALLFWMLRTRAPVRVHWPLLYVALLIVWMICSAWWSVDAKLTLQLVPTYAGLMFLFMVLSVAPITLHQYRMLLITAVLSAGAASIYAIYDFRHDPLLGTQDASEARLFMDVSGARIDPNLFADAMLFPFAIVTVFTLSQQTLSRKIAGYTVMAVLGISIALSASREAALGAALILIYCGVRMRRLLHTAGIAVAGLAAGALISNPLANRFLSLDSERQSIWSVGIAAFKHRWFAGYGLGTFVQVYDQYYLKVRQLYPYGWDSPAHNVAVHFMVELGVVGLLLIVLMFVSQFWQMRHVSGEGEVADYRVMCEAGLIALACAAMFIDLFNTKWAWFVLAMSAQLCNLPAAITQRQSAPRSVP